MGDGERRSGKSTALDGVAKNAESTRKLLLLPVESGQQGGGS